MVFTVRECWVLAALPGILTAGICIYGPGGAAQRKCAAAQAEFQKELSKPVEVRALQALHAEFNKTQEALNRARELANAPAGGTHIGPESEDRNDALRTISQAVEKHGMKLFESRKVENGGPDGLPKRTQEAWKAYAAKFHAPAPQLWRIVLRGSYPDMQSVCDDLVHANAFIAPLTVTMETPAKNDPRGPALIWTLTLWL